MSADPTTTGPRRRRDAARNRDRLLDAAAAVFTEQGLDGTVGDVARVAGVGVGTVYRHFPTKEAIIDELVHELLADVLDDAREAFEELEGRGLRTFLFALGERQAQRHDCLPRLWSAASEAHRELRRAIHGEIAELLADAQRHRRARPEITPVDVFAVILSLHGVIETMRHAAPDQWRRHLELVLAGLEPSDRPLEHKPAPKRAIHRLIATR